MYYDYFALLRKYFILYKLFKSICLKPALNNLIHVKLRIRTHLPCTKTKRPGENFNNLSSLQISSTFLISEKFSTRNLQLIKKNALIRKPATI